MKLKHKAIAPARIEMLPLIDIVFLLLVFFIYAMLSMAVHRGMQLDLPESSEAEKSKETPLSLSIQAGSKEPKIFLGEEAVPLLEIHQHIAFLHDSASPPQVLIFADKTLPYQQLYQVLDELQKNGINDISLQASAE
ncbi:MAG: biopolymer transporter ExbD [Proteobacteria bacterium]|nr:biopolymer transporter ExbD [Pseudomonadota bacterium]MBU1060238.1 biopolymer transporter ExbD [Pseudomonadota bacterium]